jgi:hypothetical protein
VGIAVGFAVGFWVPLVLREDDEGFLVAEDAEGFLVLPDPEKRVVAAGALDADLMDGALVVPSSDFR